MKLFIGGFAQGKLHYVLQREKLRDPEHDVWDACLPERQREVIVVNHLHRYIREMLAQGKDPEEPIRRLVESCPECILICDEIGNGIVPMDAGEREYRERTGRILERLASEADEVVRVVCGIGQKLS